MTDVHHYDQTLAEADRTLDAFVAEFARAEAELGDMNNMLMLDDALTDLPETALAPLLAVAIRRLARAGAKR
jgi:hypothetical protein